MTDTNCTKQLTKINPELKEFGMPRGSSWARMTNWSHVLTFISSTKVDERKIFRVHVHAIFTLSIQQKGHICLHCTDYYPPPLTPPGACGCALDAAAASSASAAKQLGANCLAKISHATWAAQGRTHLLLLCGRERKEQTEHMNGGGNVGRSPGPGHFCAPAAAPSTKRPT